MTKCGEKCCAIVPTPGNSSKKVMKSYRVFIWTMFSLMLVTYLVCVPLAFAFTIGGVMVPVGLLSLTFSSIFSPGCGTVGQLKKHYPEYYLKLSNYNTINWVLGLSSFVGSVCAASMFYYFYFYDTNDFYRSCLYGPEYVQGNVTSTDYRLSFNYEYYCPMVMAGFVFAIITSVSAAIQIAFSLYCLRLQYYAGGKSNSALSNGNTVNRNGMDGDRYDIQPQIIEPSPNAWDGGKKNKNKKNKNKNMIDGMPMNDPRVEQLVFAIQGMSGQIRNLQDGIQVKPQQYQQIQTQTQMGQPSVYSQLNNLQ